MPSLEPRQVCGDKPDRSDTPHACRWMVHIVDTNPNSLSARGWLEDTSKVQKYTMSDEEYKARENTYWKYKEEKLKVLFSHAPSNRAVINECHKGKYIAGTMSQRRAMGTGVSAAQEPDTTSSKSMHRRHDQRACKVGLSTHDLPTVLSLHIRHNHSPVLMQEDPEWTAEKELCVRRGIPYVPPKQKENIEDEDYMSNEASRHSVGERCEVDPGGKRGVIR